MRVRCRICARFVEGGSPWGADPCTIVSSGVRLPAVSPYRLRMTRFPLPLALLLASLGLTAIAAVESHRAAQSQRETADRAMRELASFAAWN